MTKSEIISYAKSIGAINCGVAEARIYDELIPILEKRGFVPFVRKDLQQRINPFLQLKTAKSVIVCLFPYQSGGCKDVALYAKGGDYHPYVKAKLQQICDYIGDFNYKLLVDTGRIPEKHLAYLAGLGFFGKNQLFYTDGYGSRFYIGAILCDLELEADRPIDKKCIGCNKCVESCVGGALGYHYEFDVNKCASYLTQKKGELTKEEQEIIGKCGYTLGCDVCSDVCPLNRRS